MTELVRILGPLEYLGVDRDHRQQVVEVVRDLAGQPAERFEPLGRLHLLAESALRLLGAYTRRRRRHDRRDLHDELVLVVGRHHHPLRGERPPFKPCMRISRTRLTGGLS
jgi:hypothetical protein